jgi:type IV pilus assembly protein PilB
LEDATEGFEIQPLKEDDGGEDSLTVERLTSDISPIIRLVDSAIFRRCSERGVTSIETQDDAVHVSTDRRCRSRRCGRRRAVPFVDHLASRFMAEPDIAEKRVPQDG